MSRARRLEWIPLQPYFAHCGNMSDSLEKAATFAVAAKLI